MPHVALRRLVLNHTSSLQVEVCAAEAVVATPNKILRTGLIPLVYRAIPSPTAIVKPTYSNSLAGILTPLPVSYNIYKESNCIIQHYNERKSTVMCYPAALQEDFHVRHQESKLCRKSNTQNKAIDSARALYFSEQSIHPSFFKGAWRPRLAHFGKPAVRY